MDTPKTKVQRALQQLVRRKFDQPITAAEIDDLARKQVVVDGRRSSRRRSDVVDKSVVDRSVPSTSIPKPSGRRGSPIAVDSSSDSSDSDGWSDRSSSMIDDSPFSITSIVSPSVIPAAEQSPAVSPLVIQKPKPDEKSVAVGTVVRVVRPPPILLPDQMPDRIETVSAAVAVAAVARPPKRLRFDGDDLNRKESAAAQILSSSSSSDESNVASEDGNKIDLAALAGRLTPPISRMVPSAKSTVLKRRRGIRSTPCSVWQRRLAVFRNVRTTDWRSDLTIADDDDPFNPDGQVWKTADASADLRTISDAPVSKFLMPEDLSRGGLLFIFRPAAKLPEPTSPPTYDAPPYGY